MGDVIMKIMYAGKSIMYKCAAVLTIIFTLIFGQAAINAVKVYLNQQILNIILSDGAPSLCIQKAPRMSDILIGFDIYNPSSIIENLPVMAENQPVENPPEEKKPEQPNVTERTEPSAPAAAYNTDEGIVLKNNTDYTIDTAKLINENLDFKITKKTPSVLIVHTHTSECYQPVDAPDFEASDSHRTQNPKYSVVRVGEEFKKGLESEGIVALHDTTVHDYPSYNGSYINTMKTIEKRLAENPSIKIVIDLHRDAVEADGNVYKYSSQIDGKPTAQVMIISGSDANGIENPNWIQNLKFSLKYQRRMNLLYPGLTRPLSLVRERYNTHLTTGSIILEVGTTGNTLEEAVNAGYYSGRALGNMLGYITE